MGSYISSNSNRFYVALEDSYALAPTITAANRFPAAQLHAHQALEIGKRSDKTGTRSYLGSAPTARRHTAFEISAYLTSWNGSSEPPLGPLVQAGMGAAPSVALGLTIAAVTNGTEIQAVSPHGLSVGSAISTGTEIRFVTGVNDSQTLVINAPFAVDPAPGTVLAPTIAYHLATALPSLTLCDYWDPSNAVSRILVGGAVDTMEIGVNGDYHELVFSGPGADLIDSASAIEGPSGLTAFPSEPELAAFDYSIVPGHLGQVWLGNPASQVFTLTHASLAIRNNLAVRNHEVGSSYPRTVAAGPREIVSTFTLFAQDSPDMRDLYAAAKTRGAIPAMWQLGRQQGQIMGIFLPNVIPEVPTYDDSETALLWDFKNNSAQGISNDEAYIAFA